MKKININILYSFIAIILILIILFFAIIMIVSPKEIDYELVASYDYDALNDSTINWFSLRNKEYSPFFDIEFLENNYGISVNETLDTENYTYIVTVGRELSSIKYSYAITKNRKFLFVPKQYIGIVTLNENSSDQIYIYKIKKMDIDCDYHDTEKFVSFE